MTCLGCKYARLCIMYEPRMKACKDYKNDNSAKQEVTDMTCLECKHCKRIVAFDMLNKDKMLIECDLPEECNNKDHFEEDTKQ